MFTPHSQSNNLTCNKNYMTKEIILILDDVRPESMNPYWVGSVRREDRASYAIYARLLVRSQIDPQDIEMFEKPVKITFTGYFDKNPLDATNMMTKPFEDGLIGWLIEDDNWRAVSEVSKRSRLDRTSPRLEIHIEEIDT